MKLLYKLNDIIHNVPELGLKRTDEGRQQSQNLDTNVSQKIHYFIKNVIKPIT